MNRYLLTAIFLLLTAHSVFSATGNNIQNLGDDPTIVYVKQGGSGSMDGSNWTNAMANLQAAVDSAAAWGSDVWVAEGIYYGDTLNSNGSFVSPLHVHVYGGFAGNEPATFNIDNRNISAHPTILDAQHKNRVLYFDYWGEDTTNFTTWDGFVLQNGYVTDWYGGGGAYLSGNFSLANCIVRNNENGDWSASGGGVSISGGLLSNCQIHSNYAQNGGGVSASNSTIENCLIAHNRAFDGSGMLTDNSQIINCNIVNNYATGNEWGIGSGIIMEGLVSSYGGYSIFKNCIVWGNSSQGTRLQFNGNGGMFSHCAIEGGNVLGSHNFTLSAALCGEQFSPCFADTSLAALPNGYALQQSSICINQGDNTAAAYITKDLAGNNRIRNNTVDIGCFESNYNASALPTFPDGIIYVAQGGRGTQSGQNWSNAMSSPKDAVSMAELCGVSNVWVAAGTYAPTAEESSSSAFFMSAGINVYGGFIGNEPTNYNVTERNWRTNATILSGDDRMRVLEQVSDFPDSVSATWSGFYLRHGNASGSGTAAKLKANGNLTYCIIDSNRLEYPSEDAYGGIINANDPDMYYGEGPEGIDTTRNIHIDHCIIRNNSVSGAFYAILYARNAEISNCLFSDNSFNNTLPEYLTVGGIALDNSSMTNCDVVNNYRVGRNGVINIIGNALSSMTNCIVWDELNNEQAIMEGEMDVSYSAIRGGFTGTGNIDLSNTNRGSDPSTNYPRFYMPENGDYHLLPNSPCVNAGSNSASIGTSDVAGLNRNYNGRVDMGCYEYNGEQYCVAPTQLMVDAITGNSVHLTWTNQNASAPLRYELQFRLESESSWTSIPCATTDTFVNNLSPLNTYCVQVRSICSTTDFSDYSDTLLFTTPCLYDTCDGTECQVPNYIVTNIQANSVAIECPSTLVAEQTEIQYRRSTDSTWTNQSMIYNPQTIINLIPNMEYVIRVRTRCSATVFSEWNEKTFTTSPQVLDVIYVTENGSGLRDGGSWMNATNDLQWAINQAHQFHETYGTHPKVFVAEGTYYSTIEDTKNSFIIQSGMSVYGGLAGDESPDFDMDSRNIASHPTILDGQNAKRVLYQSEFFGNEDSTLWDGFILTHGYSNDTYGAGCYISGGKMTLRNCTIRECNTSNTENNVVALNAGFGATIDHCEICNNQNEIQRNGSLIKLYYCNANCLIVRNNDLLKDFIAAEFSTLNNCLFANNNHNGLFRMNFQSKIINSTVVCNKNYNYGLFYCSDSNVIPDSLFVNCIFWNNRATDNYIESASCVIHCAIEGAIRGDGNLTLSKNNNDYYGPKFVNPSPVVGIDMTGFTADWHLQNSSFCINRGLNDYTSDTLDISRSTRIQQGEIDLGCYESNFTKHSTPVFASNTIYVTETGAGNRSGISWDNALSDMQMALNLSYLMGIPTVKVAEGTYDGDSTVLYISEGTHLIGGFVGDSLSTGHYSTLDGQNCHAIIRTRNLYDFNTELPFDSILIKNFIIANSGLKYNENANTTEDVTYLPFSNIDNCIFIHNANDTRPNAQFGPVVRGFGNISNCIIDSNGTYALKWNGKIEKTTISNNDDYIWSSDSIDFYNCQIINNRESMPGGYTYNPDSDCNQFHFHNCLIANNEGFLGCIRTGKYYNCDIVNNKVTRDDITTPIYADFYNSVFWGNRYNQNYEILDPRCEANYSAIEGGLNGEHNIALSSSNDEGTYAPHFINPSTISGNTNTTAFDWHFKSDTTNCCINTGYNGYGTTSRDLDDSTRIYANIIDRGCYESRSTDTFNFPAYHGIVYVNAHSNSNGDGSSWINATRDLQFAIDLAHTIGADVWVAEGTYYGSSSNTAAVESQANLSSASLFYAKDGVNVYGGFAGDEPADFDLEHRAWKEHPTVLDGLEQSRILFQHTDFHTIPFTTWSGFTFRNGKTNGDGGAAYLHNHFSIEKSIFENNKALVTPFDNQYDSIPSYGGALFINTNDTVSLRECEFTNNTAIRGGAIFGAATASIDRCNIHHNSANNDGALLLSAQGNRICNSIIAYNHCNLSIMTLNGSMVNCNIVNNEVSAFRTPYYFNDDIINIGNNHYYIDNNNYYSIKDTAMVNCIFWGNHGNDTISQHDFNTTFINNLGCLYYNCAFENLTAGDNFIPLAHENSGYTDTIPYVNFANPNALNYRLCNKSRCIDQGLILAGIDSLDYYGNPRIVNGKIDIGASSHSDTCWYEQAPYRKIYYVTEFGSGNGSSWNNAMGDLQTAIDSAHAHYLNTGEMSKIWVAQGYYYGRDVHDESAFILREGASIFGSFTGDEPADFNIDNRDFLANPSILDGAESQRVLCQPASLTEQVPSIIDGFIFQNGHSSGNGGGAYLGAHTLLNRCIFKNNYAADKGGGIYGLNGQYTNCLFTNNEAEDVGGGIYADYAVLTNCNIVKNKSEHKGGGIYSFYTSLLTNCVLWNNIGDGDNKPYAGVQRIHYSAVEDGCPGENNITLAHDNTGRGQFHPNFDNPSTVIGIDTSIFGFNYTPTDASILLNRGNNTAAESITTDIKGNQRIQGQIIDIGCIESVFDTIIPIAASPDTIYVTASGAGNYSGHSWENACSNLNDALMMAKMRSERTTIWVAKGTYYGEEGLDNAFIIPPHTDVYGGFTGNEPNDFDLTLRNFDLNECILSGRNEQRVLYQSAPFSNEDAVTWDGFTIRDGQITTGYGAGAYLQDNFALQNCEISYNFTRPNVLLISEASCAGIYADASEWSKCILKNCYIHNNASNTDISGIYAHNAIIDNCIIAENTSQNYGSNYSALFSHSLIRDCTIEENIADMSAVCRHCRLERCKILKNSQKGIMVDDTYLSNCLIANNSGTGVFVDGDLTMVNCDIVNNTTTENPAGIGIMSEDRPHIYLRNSILWGNKIITLPDYFQTNEYAYWHISHCAFEGSDIEGDGNINLSSYNDGFTPFQHYVRFNDPSHEDFTLHQSSICIDHGDTSVISDSIDLKWDTRVKGFSVEIGCYETNVDSSCLSVTNVQVQNLQNSEVSISWHPEGSENEWAILLHQDEGPDSVIVTNQNPITISGLHHNREYSAVVKARCDSVSTSVNSLPAYFFIPCDTSSLTPIPEFTNMRPVDSTLIYYTTVDFYWESMPDATSYNLYLWSARELMPSNPLYSGLTSAWLENVHLDTIFPYLWEYGAEFYWKVEAVNECISRESPIHYFQVDYLPDLHVTMLTHSAATATQPMTVQWTVRNDGLGHTPPGETWKDYLWLSSTDQVLGPLSQVWYNWLYDWCCGTPFFYGIPTTVDETLLATINCPSSLAPGQSYNNQTTVTIPDSCLGTYFLYALTDQQCTSKIIFDVDGDSLSPDIMPVPYTPSLDGHPYYYFYSDYYDFKSTDTVLPSGMRYYVRNDELKDNFKRAIKSQIYEGEENAEYDNFFYDKLQVSTPPAADFVVSHIHHPANAFTLDTIPVTWTISNVGTIGYEGNWTDVVYLLRTKDSAKFFNNETTILLDDSSMLNTEILGFFDHSGYLGPGESLSFTHNVCIPNNALSTHTILVKTDFSDIIYESINNENNTSSSGICLSITMIPPPDLVLSNLQFDSIVSSDMDMPVEFDVENIGAGATVEDYWEDAVLIRCDSTFFIARFPHQGVLAPGESYHVSANVHIPNNYSGIANLTAQTDANSDVFEYLEKQNNIIRADSALRIFNPDIIVLGINFREGDTLTLNSNPTAEITIANVGEGILYDKQLSCVFYYDNEILYKQNTSHYGLKEELTPKITLYPCRDISGRSIIHSRLPIANYDNCTYTFEVVFNKDFACDTISQHSISAVIDYRDVAYESNENNNQSDTISIFITEPDLTVEDIYITSTGQNDTDTSSSNNYQTGDEIMVNWTVANVGNTSAYNEWDWVDHIYISHYPNNYESGILIGEYTHHDSIGAGASQAFSSLFTLPMGFYGNCYIHVVTNAHNELCEGSNETSNWNHSYMFPVTLRPYPDLTICSFELPDTIMMGSTVQVNYTLKNSSFATQPIAGFVTEKIRIYQYIENDIHDIYIDLGSHTHYTNLNVNDSASYSFSFQIPNHSSVQGVWIVRLTTDANEEYYEYMYEDNNIKEINTVFKLNDFDLQADSLIKISSAPFRWGEEANVKLVYENTSNVLPQTQRCFNEIYLSQDVLFDNEDVLLKTLIEENIQAYEIIEQSSNITIPMGANEYSYLIAVCNNKNSEINYIIPEKDFSNNTLVVPIHVEEVPVPDLAISDMEILTSSVISGQEISVAYTITNVGDTALASETWTDKFFLSIDSVFGTSDLQIASHARERNLLVGESYRDTANIIIPIPNSGRMYLMVYANANSDFFEDNRSNNVIHHDISIQLPDPGDLIVTHIYCDDSLISGDNLSINWKVKNIGEYVLIGNGLRSLVYISSDTTFDSNDRLLGEVVSDNINLTQNAMVSQSLTTRVANIPEGNYYIIIKTNVSMNFYEENTQNNQSTSLQSVHVMMKALPFNTPVSDVLDNGIAEDYKLTVDDNINETVRVSVQSDHSAQGAVNNIFIQHNNVANNMNYCYSTVGQNIGDAEVFIPSTQADYYGINVLGSTPVDTTQNITLEADILPLTLLNVTPNYGGNKGVVTVELTGSKFRDDMPVWLDNGHDTIHCRKLIYDNYYHAYAEFDLTGRDTGRYDVNILNLCDGIATLADTFHIIESIPEHLSLNLIIPQAVRIYHTIVLTLEFQNQGSEDLVNPVIKLSNSVECWLGLTSSSLGEHNTEIEIPLTIEGDLPYILRPGAYGTINIYCYANNRMMTFVVDRVR